MIVDLKVSTSVPALKTPVCSVDGVTSERVAQFAFDKFRQALPALLALGVDAPEHGMVTFTISIAHHFEKGEQRPCFDMEILP